MIEKELQNDIIKYCQYTPFCDATRPLNYGVKAKRPCPTSDGMSDINIDYYGRSIHVETKRPGAKQTDNQKEYQRRKEAAKSEYWLIDSLEDFIKKMEEFKRKHEV